MKLCQRIIKRTGLECQRPVRVRINIGWDEELWITYYCPRHRSAFVDGMPQSHQDLEDLLQNMLNET